MAGMGLDGMGADTSVSRYFAFVNIYRHRNGARPDSWVGLSFVHKSIWNQHRSLHVGDTAHLYGGILSALRF